MTVESNYVVAWLVIGLKDSRQFFNQWEAKPKPITPCTRDFSRASSELQVIATNCDWFMAMFVALVIGQSDYFGFGFSTVIWKPLLARLTAIIIDGKKEEKFHHLDWKQWRHLEEQNHVLVLEDKAGQILMEVAVNMAALSLEDKPGHMMVGQAVVLVQPRDHMWKICYRHQ